MNQRPRCKKCGRPLQSPASIARGMGSKCAGIGPQRRTYHGKSTQHASRVYDAVGSSTNQQPLPTEDGLTKRQQIRRCREERRNLLIHKDGVVDQTYLDHVGRSTDIHLLNRRMQVSSAYLAKSIDLLYFYGFILLQQCWRAWLRGNHKLADRLFVAATFSLLEQERYKLVICIGEMASSFKMQRDEMQNTMVNHAIALRDLGYRVEMHKLIKLCEPPANQDIRIALHVLREEYNLAHILILHAHRGKKGTPKNLSAAKPLFKPVIDDPRFSGLFGG